MCPNFLHTKAIALPKINSILDLAPSSKRLEKRRHGSEISAMPFPTLRRTDAVKFRQTISLVLDQISAIEHSIETFHDKGHRPELERAAAHFNDMLGYVDRLGEMIADARAKQLVPEKA
jgi:hypothetical protein